MITFSTCWYPLKSKFSETKYKQWMKNMLLNVNNYKLVVYCCPTSLSYLESLIKDNKNIRIIVKPVQKFYNYKYKRFWEINHKKNTSLNKRITWEVNMLWSEKVHFVYETMKQKYFDTEYYGWCDIGYFRCSKKDTPSSLLKKWPNHIKVKNLNPNKIHYANTNLNRNYLNQLFKIVREKNNLGLPIRPIPPTQYSIAGGFFISHKNKLTWWRNTFDKKLSLYFKNNYLVKDDQMIIVDCVFSELEHFQLHYENNSQYDNWFLFQRILL